MPRFPSKRPRDEHLRPQSAKSAVMKGLFFLVLIVILTYVGKFSPNERKAVREHGLLGWNFPTKEGIAALLVLADDGDDTNLEKTGHRIWLNPPRHPELIIREAAYFKGPQMTVVADSLRMTAIEQIASSVDSGGTLYLLGKQMLSLDSLRASFAHLRISQDTLPPFLEIPLGTDAKGVIETHEDNWRFRLEQNGYRLQFYSQADHSGFLEQPTQILGFLEQAKPSQLDTLCKAGLCTHILFSTKDSILTDQHQTNLWEPDHGFLFYEDQEKQVLQSKKIDFQHWDRQLQ